MNILIIIFNELKILPVLEIDFKYNQSAHTFGTPPGKQLIFQWTSAWINCI